jgi:tetratricopeptide (TPR) repeat protein
MFFVQLRIAAFSSEEPEATSFLCTSENVHENLNQYDEALRYYQKATQLDEHLSDAWVGIGSARCHGTTSEALV